MSRHRTWTPEQRILERVVVDETTGCWIWQKALGGGGYGQFGIGDTVRYAHRFAYELWVGPIPAGMTIDHLCHSNDPTCPGGECVHRRCCNPAHLEVVTRGENVLRGVGFAAVNARKTHCPQGHEYTPENTFVVKATGWRNCRKCGRERCRARKAAA